MQRVGNADTNIGILVEFEKRRKLKQDLGHDPH